MALAEVGCYNVGFGLRGLCLGSCSLTSLQLETDRGGKILMRESEMKTFSKVNNVYFLILENKEFMNIWKR